MANIRETLEIQDRFSSTLQRFNSLGERASRTLNKMGQSLDDFGKKQVSASKGAGTFLKVIGGIAAARGFVGLADSLTLTEARLNAVKGDLVDVSVLQDMIFAAAQRSRGDYLGMMASVASIKAQTGDLFKSNEEAVAFMEALNKQFAISGTSAAGIQSTMYNLTQALATGVLRGNDLQMILSNSPAIIQRIADYMGEPIGKIREMAQDGQITADIVKNAIMRAAGDIDEQFDKMPMTFGQAMQKVKNEGIRALRPMTRAFTNFVNSENFERIMGGTTAAITVLAEVGTMALNGLAAAADWAVNNYDILMGVLGAVAAGYLILQGVSVASAIATAVSWMIAYWPITLIAAGIGVAIASALAAGASFEQVGAVIGGVFGTIYTVGYTCFAFLWNQVAQFVEFFANVWNDPLGSIVRFFVSTFDNILQVVETTAKAIDALMGSNLSAAVAGFRGKIQAWADETVGAGAVQVQRMESLDVSSTIKGWSQAGGGLGAKIDNLGSTMEGIMDGLGGSGFEIPDYSDLGGGKKANVGSVDKVKEAKLSDEDVKIYRDLAERRYMANVELQTLAPNISVSIPESAAKNLTSEDIANKLKAILIEQQASHTAVAHG